MRTFILAVTGLALIIGYSACSSGGTSVVQVENPQVAAVTVALPSPSLIAGQTARATATAVDANGAVLTDRPIAWASSAITIATVDNSGMIAAVAPGTATITATSEGKSGSQSLSVTAPAPNPVASVTVSPANPSGQAGTTVQLSATTRDANNAVLTGRAVTWASSNAGIATVSAAGLVSAIAAGTATITATSEGQSGAASLTVSAAPPVAVASVTVSLANSSRNPGQTTQATATTRDANNNILSGRVVTWGSSNTAVATVSSSGVVTAIVAGTAQITATSEGKSGSATFTVDAPPPPAPVASISVSLASSSVIPGETTQATATTRDANNNVLTGRAINWSSSNAVIASVSQSGLVTGVAVGTGVQITATSEGVSGSATVNVQAAPPPPPGGSNEPGGMTVIVDRAFNALGESGWYDESNPNVYLETDATAPKSPGSVIVQRYPTGFGGGASPGISEKGLGSRYTTLYVSYWMKLSSNWYGHPGSSVNKQMHLWINGGNHVFTLAYGSGSGSLRAEIWLQGTAAGERNLQANLGNPGTITRGQWHRWEILLTSNTNGAANGRIEWWLDGVKIGQYYDVRLEPVTSSWETIQWSPTWGGTGSSVPATQFESVDHLYISGKN